MSGPRTSPVFLERASYRQRRLTDAARLLPILGMVLWSVPLLWPADDRSETSNASALLYVFGLWVMLIICSALIAHSIKPGDVPTDAESAD